MKRAAFLASLFCALLLSGAAFAAPVEEVVVSGATSLMNVFEDMAKAFGKENPDVRVLLNFGASGALLRQMENGAPVDVFASADSFTMEEAVKRKLVATNAVRVFASNRLVLAVPANSASAVSSPPDLLKPSVKLIAVGDPSFVPLGRYSVAALTALGLNERLRDKFIMCRNARQAVDYVARGEVDAGIIFETDAAQSPGKVTVVTVIPTPSPIAYKLAVTVSGENTPAASRFSDFVLGEKGRVILKSYGFLPP